MKDAYLSKAELRDLYDAHGDPWPQWRKDYLKAVGRVQGWSDEELRLPQNQEWLWAIRPVAGIGAGEAVRPPKEAYQDKALTDLIVDLRRRPWSQLPAQRAAALDSAYAQILAKVAPYTPKRPMACLSRLFAAVVPAHTTTCINWKSWQELSELLLGERGTGQIASWVLMRQRLRDVLGPESAAGEPLEEHVRRSIFCWWLFDNIETIRQGEAPTKPTAISAEPTPESGDVDLLALHPFNVQRKGLDMIRGTLDTFRNVVQSADNGASEEQIVDTLRADFGMSDLSPAATRRLVSRVRIDGFLRNEGGVLYPTDDGKRLVYEDPPDVLIERWLRSVFGVAWALRIVHETGPLSRSELGDALRAIYPNWTSQAVPNTLETWIRVLGLTQSEGGQISLTELGRYWHRRLPADLPRPPAEAESEDEAGDLPLTPGRPLTTHAPGAFEPLPFEAVERSLKEAAEGFVLPEAELRALHRAWHMGNRKRFVICAGLSGTGKTQLLLRYAKAYVQAWSEEVERPELALRHHRAVVAVSPDWRDPTGLLGYHNPLHDTATYHIEPALALTLRAAQDPTRPYFLILDEMNLAPVERYLAPFLSAMESGEELALHGAEDPVNGVPPTIPWPRNLFIGGTVNMDESTHPISDKVLDRAFTLEFWEADLAALFALRDDAGRVDPPSARALLTELYAALKPARRHFAYRTASEVLDYLAIDAGGSAPETLDQAIYAKVLPRLRGHQTPELTQALDTLIALFAGAELTRCEAKLRLLKGRLGALGVTGFWS